MIETMVAAVVLEFTSVDEAPFMHLDQRPNKSSGVISKSDNSSEFKSELSLSVETFSSKPPEDRAELRRPSLFLSPRWMKPLRFLS